MAAQGLAEPRPGADRLLRPLLSCSRMLLTVVQSQGAASLADPASARQGAPGPCRDESMTPCQCLRTIAHAEMGLSLCVRRPQLAEQPRLGPPVWREAGRGRDRRPGQVLSQHHPLARTRTATARRRGPHLL